MRDLPDHLSSRPFTREEAREAGISDRMLQGQRFVRVLPRVWASRDLEMTWARRLDAARLSLPAHALITGTTRLQLAGLDVGARDVLHFVVEGDLHLDLPRVFLHRTRRLAPRDDVGIGISGAFLACCAQARLIDAIAIGDLLLARGLVHRGQLESLALAAPWRDGAHEVLWVLDQLDPRSRSVKESELRAILTFAGLPAPLVNAPLVLDGVVVVADLLYEQERLVLEYQGVQHQEDRRIYSADLDRLELLRAHGYGYIEVTKERLAHPRTTVGRVYRELVSRGYAGPPPYLDARWTRLFSRLSSQVGPRSQRARGA